MSGDNADKLTRLEERGKIAADYLEESLDVADLNDGVEIDVKNGRVSVEIIADDPDALDRPAGDGGEVPDALQELTRLTVQTETGECLHFTLDIAGPRAEHKGELQDITCEAIARMRAIGEVAKLDVMNPFERKVYHDVVADEGPTSESEDVEPHHRTVIFPEGTGGG